MNFEKVLKNCKDVAEAIGAPERVAIEVAIHHFGQEVGVDFSPMLKPLVIEKDEPSIQPLKKGSDFKPVSEIAKEAGLGSPNKINKALESIGLLKRHVPKCGKINWHATDRVLEDIHYIMKGSNIRWDANYIISLFQTDDKEE
jgi:hypothetical protein